MGQIERDKMSMSILLFYIDFLRFRERNMKLREMRRLVGR